MVCPANGSSPRQRWQPSSSSPMSRLFLRQPSLIPLLMMFVGGILVGTFLSTQMDTSVIYQRRHLIDTSFYIPSIPQQQQQQLSQPQKDGWQTIHVFTGESAATDEASSQSQPHFSFAQARQDEVVLRLLKNQTNGYFIDLAANDATVLSNTYSLERYFGWEGLCIEPNPTYWYNLTRHRPNCQVVGAVVGQERMEHVFFQYSGEDHGGIAGEGFDNGPRHQRTSIMEYTVPLQEIFQRFETPRVIDYLSLDVEGAELFIMKSFPLHEYVIRVMTIERPKEELKTLLKQHGYNQVLRLSRWGETLWVHSSFANEMDFSHLEDFHGKKQWEEQKAREAPVPSEQQH